MTQLVVSDGQIEVHLARILRLKLTLLQVDDYETSKRQMIKQKIYVEIVVTDLKTILTSDEREALTEFQEETFEPVEKIRFEFPLVKGLFECQEVEDIRIFKRLLDEVRLRSREESVEVRQGPSLLGGGPRT